MILMTNIIIVTYITFVGLFGDNPDYTIGL